MKVLWSLFWGGIVAVVAGLMYTYRKELGFVPETKKLNESMVFTAQNSALLLDELQKAKDELNSIKGTTETTVIANETIDKNKVVCFNNGLANLYQPANNAINDFPIGIAKESVAQGQRLRVAIAGIVDDFTGIVVNTNYYASANGGITDVAPTSGMLRSVGFAIDADSLFLDFGQKVEL